MFWKLGLFSLGVLYTGIAVAQMDDKMCQESLLKAENVRNENIYTECGFDEVQTALNRWTVWAEQHNATQAMYELCRRYPQTRDGKALCQKAEASGNGLALLRLADQFYAQGKYVEALKHYTQALKSPLLTQSEKGHISENIGILYVNPKSNYYNAQKGLPLLEKSAQQRGAIANNILGAYYLFGAEGLTANSEKSFEYFWRAILLGCPNAEENLGLFHLLRQQQITPKTAAQIMQDKIYTCATKREQTISDKPKVDISQCHCSQVLERAEMAKQYPYQLKSIEGESALLQDTNRQNLTVKANMSLPNGAIVMEIRKTAVIVKDNNGRHILNLAPDEECLVLCTTEQPKKQTGPTIKPYHLSFTHNECADILYYAERLVDTTQPFTGKTECHFSGELDDATQMLLAQ